MIGFAQIGRNGGRERIYLFERPKAGDKLRHWAVCDLHHNPRYPNCRHQEYLGGLLVSWPVPLDAQDQWQTRRDALMVLANSYAQ